MTLLIKNGRVIDPGTGRDGSFDVLISGANIVQVKSGITDPADQIIDAKGCYVMPGLIDMHVHLREPGFEYKETIQTGALSAAQGGFTTICPMPNTKPVIDNPGMVSLLKEKSLKDAVVNILPVGSVTMNQEGKQLSDISGMAKAGVCGISEDGYSVMDEQLYLKGMKCAANEGILVMAHCEDKDLVKGGVMNAGAKAEELSLPGITNEVEDAIIRRDIHLAEEAGAKLHLCHCSTKDSVTLLKEAKDLGQLVSGEVCPHHFTMSDDEIPSNDSNYKMNPPLRSKEDVLALKKALKDGIMDVISTDHAPHSEEEKKRPMENAPFGIVGLETAVALTITELVEQGFLTPMQMAERMSYTPAKLLGIPKGTLKEGSIADVTIIDPVAEYRIEKESFVSLGKNTPFHGRTVRGKVCYTIVNGKVVYQAKHRNEDKND